MFKRIRNGLVGGFIGVLCTATILPWWPKLCVVGFIGGFVAGFMNKETDPTVGEIA